MGLGSGSETNFGSPHVVEQLSFSMLPSILTFDFELIMGNIFTFRGPTGLFLGLGSGSNIFLGPTYDRLTTLILEV